VWIDGVGHMPNLEHPDAFNAAVLHFLEQLQVTRARAR
jgi:pimeloyl-ACP methyl ester carboxylesterase